MPPLLSWILTAVASFVSYSGLSGIIKAKISQGGRDLKSAQVANCITTIVHAILASVGGIWVFLSSRYDVVHGLAWPSGLANLVTLHSLGYFGFDWRDLWRAFKVKNGPKSRIQDFLISNPVLNFHHAGIFAIFAPVALCFRRGLGDSLIGLSFAMEVSTPFVAVRKLLRLSGISDNSAIFLFNEVLMISAYFVFRIASLPYVYFIYSRQSGLDSVFEAFRTLKWHCNLGSAALVSFQSYWFTLMVRKGIRSIFKAKTQ